MTRKKSAQGSDLQSLVNDINSASQGAFSKEELSLRMSEWTSTLMQLQKKYENAQDSEIIADTKIGNHDLFRLLQMGLNNKEEYKSALTAIIEDKHNSHAMSFAHFIKSKEGYLLFEKGSMPIDFHEGKLGELTHFIEELGGVFIAQNLTKAARAEMLGCLFAYTSSGKSEHDLRAYKGSSPEDFLLHTAQSSDQEFAVEQSSIHSLEQVRGKIKPVTRQDLTGVRARLCVDNCVVFGNTVTFCNVFSDNSPKDQKISFLRYFLAISRACRNGEIPAQNIAPLYLVQSPFPRYQSEFFNETSKGHGGNIKSYIDQAGLSTKQKDDLSQSNFLGLIGNTTHIDHLVMLFAHNALVSGGESTDLFVTSNFILEDLRSGNLPKARERAVTKAVTKIASLSESLVLMVEKNELMHKNPAMNEKKQFLDTNGSFLSMLKNHEQNIKSLGDLINQAENKDDFRNQVDVILENTQKLISLGKLSGNDNFKNQMIEMERSMFVLAGTVQSTRPVSDYEDRDPGLEKLLNSPQNEYKAPARKKVHGIDLENFREAASAFSKSFATLRLNAPVQGSVAAQKMSDYLDLLASCGLNPSKISAPYQNNSASTTFRSLQKELESYGCPLMSEFVKKSRFLLQEKFTSEMKSGDLRPGTIASLEGLADFMERKMGENVDYESTFDKRKKSKPPRR